MKLRRWTLAVTLALLTLLSACSRKAESLPSAETQIPTQAVFTFPNLDPEVNYLMVSLNEPSSSLSDIVTQSATGLHSLSLDLEDETVKLERVTGNPVVVLEDVLPGTYRVTATGYDEQGGLPLYTASRTVEVLPGAANAPTAAKGADATPVKTQRLSLRRVNSALMTQSMESGSLRLWHRHNQARLTWNGVDGTSGDEKLKPGSGLSEIAFPVLTVTPVDGVTEVGGGEGYGVKGQNDNGKYKKSIEGDEALELRLATGLGFTTATLNFRIAKNSTQAVILETYRGDDLVEEQTIEAVSLRGKAKSDKFPLTFETPVDRLVFRADKGSRFGLRASSFTVAPLTAITPEVVSVTPANEATAAPSTTIDLEFNTPMDRASVEAAFLLTSDALPLPDDVSFTNPTAFDKLKLTSMCEGRWRVRNPNTEAVRFTWNIAGQEERGAGIVPASRDVFFYTAGGSQTARLYMEGKQQQVKASSPSVCGSSTPVEGSFTWQDDQKVSFVPNTALEEGAYVLQIADFAKSVGGQALAPFSSSLTVKKEDASSLPAPWQQMTLGEGTGNANFDAANQAFTLNVEGNQSNHFVYQPLEGNGSLVARVTDLETIDQNGKAGLMLRGGLAPDAPYALLALTPAGITFEAKGENGTLTREAGSLQGPVWLKLERKEDRVYAYESEDGMKWRKITKLSLALSSLAVGLVVNEQDEGVQAQFEEVVVQQKPNNEKPIAQGSAVFGTGEPVGVFLPGDVVLGSSSGGLKTPTELTLKLYENRPAGRDPKFSPVGPRAVVEAPLEKFNLTDPNSVLITLWVPATPDLKQDAFNILYEVSVTLGDGRDYVYFDQYGDQWAVRITPAILSSIFGKYSEPEVLKVSVQPVDSRGWYEEFAPNEDEESSGEAPTFSALSLSYEDPKYLTGLYKIPFDVNFDSHCGSDVETMPSASSPASPPEGKTPLVLVHGWTLLNDFKTGDILGLNTVSEYPDSANAYAKKQFAPGLCYWSGFINNFLVDSVGVPLDTLRQEYELSG